MPPSLAKFPPVFSFTNRLAGGITPFIRDGDHATSYYLYIQLFPHIKKKGMYLQRNLFKSLARRFEKKERRRSVNHAPLKFVKNNVLALCCHLGGGLNVSTVD